MSRHGNNWRGGRTLASSGYVLVHVGRSHPLADVRGYAYEHRLVAQEIVGRHGEPNPTVACACGCGALFPTFDNGGRPRRYVSGHNLATVSEGG